MGWEKAGCLKGPKGDPGPRGPAGDENMAPLTAEEVKAIVGEGGGSGGSFEPKLLWEGTISIKEFSVPGLDEFVAALVVFTVSMSASEIWNLAIPVYRGSLAMNLWSGSVTAPFDRNSTGLKFFSLIIERKGNDEYMAINKEDSKPVCCRMGSNHQIVSVATISAIYGLW